MSCMDTVFFVTLLVLLGHCEMQSTLLGLLMSNCSSFSLLFSYLSVFWFNIWCWVWVFQFEYFQILCVNTIERTCTSMFYIFLLHASYDWWATATSRDTSIWWQCLNIIGGQKDNAVKIGLVRSMTSYFPLCNCMCTHYIYTTLHEFKKGRG